MFTSLQDLFRIKLSYEYNNNEISFNTLIRVEIGLRLLEILRLEKNSVLTAWSLNQGLQVPALANLQLSLIQRRWLANYRASIHRSSLRDWQNDFGIYASYPDHLRLYDLSSEDPTFENVQLKRSGRQPKREEVYDDVFGQPLPFNKEKRKYASEGKYTFPIHRDYKGELVFTKQAINEAKRIKLPAFKKHKHQEKLQYSHGQLCELAKELDRLEEEVNWKRPNRWLDRINLMVRFRAWEPNGLSEANTIPFTIDGMTHIAGMVGSGKSTIAMLIAFDLARNHQNQHVTLVVADVAEVLRLTEYFNIVLAKERPIAVPLLGPTMRAAHLTNVFRQKDFSVITDRWKLRFLDTTCLVAHWLTNVDDTVDKNIETGKEPCHALYEWGDKSEKKKSFLCPLFSICPIQQVYRDMPNAPIWITTAGGLGQAKVPAQVDDRRPPLWLIIYENSNLVIFDEVDALQGWFDKLMAPDLVLDDMGAGGLLQDTLRKLGTYPSSTFRQDSDLDRWRQTYDLTMPALRNFLGLMERNDDLRNWLSIRPFTSLRILSELAGRISGHFLWDDKEPPKAVSQLNIRLRDLFIDMQNYDLSSINLEKPSLRDELILLSSQITSYGRGQINPNTNQNVEKWVKKQVNELPDSIIKEIKERAKEYSAKNTFDGDNGDPLDIVKLAHRLELGLVASILDRDLRGLFYGWRHVQQLLGEEGMPSFIPTSLTGLLPTPPLGRWRGFRTASDNESTKKTLSLAVFEFAAVGRYFIQNFDHLLEDISGLPGPNVLAMSGTSWMPDSARFHFDIPVNGILEPEQSIQNAIRKSTFTYLPQTFEVGKTKTKQTRYIRISGTGKDMTKNLEEAVISLAKKPDKFMSPLAREIDKLDRLSIEGKEWEDRSRILLLVNSYDQARNVALILQGSLRPDLSKEVYAIVRSDDDSSEWRSYQPMKRSDIEESGHLARILVAPIGAIGRGYNIISPKTGRAAYGSIYFLVRPMTPPFDAMTMVTGINHRLDKWIKPDAPIWKESESDILAQTNLLRRKAREAWQSMEHGKFYRLMEEADRNELAATTASSIIQACGRLLRGGVPFRAYFIDASWANSTETDGGDFIARPKESLLAATIERLLYYTSDPIGKALYGAFSDGLRNPQGLQLDLPIE